MNLILGATPTRNSHQDDQDECCVNTIPQLPRCPNFEAKWFVEGLWDAFSMVGGVYDVNSIYQMVLQINYWDYEMYYRIKNSLTAAVL